MTGDPYKPPASVQKPKWSYAFQDLRGTVTALRILLWMGIVVGVVAVGGDLMRLQLVGDMMAGRRVSEAELNLSDAQQGMIGILHGALLLITAVVWLRWLVRVSANAHVLATGKLQFTPGWAAGWYFVPILNLLKPFQVMEEIWRVSQEGARYQKPMGQVVVWWALCAAAFILRGGVAWMAGQDMGHATLLTILLAHTLHVGLCVAAVALVNSLHRMQAENLERHRAAASDGVGPSA